MGFTSGTFPSTLKKAVIKPTLKRARINPVNPRSYRPVSNMMAFGKLVEKLAANQFKNFIEDNMYDQNHDRTDRKKATAVTGPDMSATFDTLNKALESISSF